MRSIGTLASRFFIWWFSELAALVPARTRAFFRRRSAALVLAPRDGDVALTLYRGGASRELGRIPLDNKAEPRRVLAQLMRGASTRYLEVIIDLPSHSVLRRSVTLPLAAQENLREVLAFEMDRHTPFKASEVAFDYHVTSADTESKRLTVDLAVTLRELVEQAGRLADSFGLALDRVGVAGGEARDGWAFNFLAHGNGMGQPAGRHGLLIASTALAAILAVVAAYLPLHAKERTLAAFEVELAESRAAALDVEQLKKRLTAQLEHDRFLIDRRMAIPTATALLAEITDRLPDDTWLVQLRWQGNKLVLSGFSPAAAALIAGLEGSPLLSEVRFGSPVTADPRVGRERFNISADVAVTPGG